MKKLLFAIFAIFVGVIGCEVPYTGPILTVDDVDRYYKSVGKDTVCLQDGFDAICIKLIPGPRGPRGKIGKPGANAPVIHIHEKSVIYEFYYEGRIILQAEKEMDTARLIAQLTAEEGAELQERVGFLPQQQVDVSPVDNNNPNTDLQDGNGGNGW